MAAITPRDLDNEQRERHRQERERHVYVIEFASNTVKVGQAKQAHKRLSEHAKSAARHGDSVTRSWFSDPHTGYQVNERALIDFCAERWPRTAGVEYFQGADFDQVVEYALGLPVVRLTPAELDELLTSSKAMYRSVEEQRVRTATRARMSQLGDRLAIVGTLYNDGNAPEALSMALDLGKQMMAHAIMPWSETDPTAAERYLIGRGIEPAEACQMARAFEIEMCAIYAITGEDIPTAFEDIARLADEIVQTLPLDPPGWPELPLDGA
ncbi:hypothetical protein FXF51_05710 [Nonomuraea sp. PA05]|uniref:hypothetical protein n=1 Tax=Nonomuraea sp. PA05 TaxID=2604466 RepID=UPI0011DB0A64|nr:hypothetical protein [Nonomuraea sp. PA05]TYB69656.1 hypothetical protein FXF51_05710 [Nonomuraea sp. PA05]